MPIEIEDFKFDDSSSPLSLSIARDNRMLGGATNGFCTILEFDPVWNPIMELLLEVGFNTENHGWVTITSIVKRCHFNQAFKNLKKKSSLSNMPKNVEFIRWMTYWDEVEISLKYYFKEFKRKQQYQKDIVLIIKP